MDKETVTDQNGKEHNKSNNGNKRNNCKQKKIRNTQKNYLNCMIQNP